jgi:hypothetical protein
MNTIFLLQSRLFDKLFETFICKKMFLALLAVQKGALDATPIREHA